MDLNEACFISRNPAKHDAEQRKSAAKKAMRVLSDPHAHLGTKTRAKGIRDKLSAYEGSNNAG